VREGFGRVEVERWRGEGVIGLRVGTEGRFLVRGVDRINGIYKIG
jgi:hypothetical protein